MKKVKKFCVPSVVPAVIVSCLIIFVGAAACRFAITSRIANIYYKLGGVGFLIAMLFAARFMFKEMYQCYAILFKKRLEYFRKIGVISQVAPDFEQGVRIFGKNLVVGKNFLFGRENGMVVMYSEIDVLYRHEHKTDYESGARPLYSFYVKFMSRGEEYTLCSLDHRQAISDEWVKLCELASLKNPNIRIRRDFQKSRSVKDDTVPIDDD